MTSKDFKLLHHGEWVMDAYAPLPGETEGGAGRSTDADRPDGHTSGIVKRFKKNERASDTPVALGWIKATYPDAIEYTGLVKNLRGVMFMVGIFGGGGFLFIFYWTGIWVPSKIFTSNDIWWVTLIVSLLMGLISLAGAIWAFTLGMRSDLFPLSDEPVIFDRRHRKVYCIDRDPLGLFKPWPAVVCEYAWDLIDAEHEATLMASGTMATRDHLLRFLVRKSATDPTIIASFEIGNTMGMSNEIVPAMWEHIRRFMEDHGPHLPTPDEPLADLEAPTGWWASIGLIGPIGRGYFKRWRDEPAFTLFMHIAAPLMWPLALLWGTGNWLSYKTAIPIDWPQEVKDAIGKATAHGKE